MPANNQRDREPTDDNQNPNGQRSGIRHWVRWFRRSVIGTFAISAFLYGAEYIRAARDWADLAENTPILSLLEKRSQQPQTQDHISHQEVPLTTGSIPSTLDVPCANWKQVRDELREAAQKSFGAERDTFKSKYKGRRLCEPGWPLKAADPARRPPDNKWSIVMSDSVWPKISLRLALTSQYQSFKHGAPIWVTGTLESLSEYGEVQIEEASIKQRHVFMRSRLADIKEPKESKPSDGFWLHLRKLFNNQGNSEKN